MALTEYERGLVRKAADELDRRGLFHGGGREPFGSKDECRVCTLGAVALAVFGDPEKWTDYVPLNRREAYAAGGERAQFATYSRIVDAVAAEVPSYEPTGATHPVSKVYAWNDSWGNSGRRAITKPEAVELLRKVAEAE